eukprot:14706752-Alexandrium_andersonii.AAC.1
MCIRDRFLPKTERDAQLGTQLSHQMKSARGVSAPTYPFEVGARVVRGADCPILRTREMWEEGTMSL